MRQNLANGQTVRPVGDYYGFLAEQMDGSVMEWSSSTYGCYFPVPASKSSTSPYANPISIGNPGRIYPPIKGVSSASGIDAEHDNVTLYTVTYLNKDNTNPNDGYDSLCNMRFRHMDNTTVNAFFIDGACGIKTIVTSHRQGYFNNDLSRLGTGGWIRRLRIVEDISHF